MDALKKLNLKFSFDESLREVPEDTTDVALAIGLLRMQVEEAANDIEKTNIMAKLGGWLRIMGELEEAEAVLSKALDIILKMPKLNPLRPMAAKLRLAHVYQWQSEFKKSTKLFEEVLAEAEQLSMPQDLIGFIHQHMGKNLFDQNRYLEALIHFEKALEIRKQGPDQELVKSTQWALEQTQERLQRKH